jgi:3-oxoacyl-(acyl-carrier-protein) synthase
MIYIRSTGNISPQKTFGRVTSLTDPIAYTSNWLTCIEPDYKEIIDAKLIRRMSRIIKMGVAAAMDCLKQAGVTVPDAVVTGTAYGCLADTEVFLTRIVENKEEMLTPTAFIQSTHNTVGAQIALMLQCHEYNNTFVHRGASFESALLDGMMLLADNPDARVLTGAVDEITNTSHTILSRMGLYRQHPVSSPDICLAPSRGTIAGEGAAFFLLTAQPSPTDKARLEGMTTIYNPDDLRETEQAITSFLTTHSIGMDDIDLIITGRNGDEKNDRIYDQLQQSALKGPRSINYKDLCGEYPTSTAFALWLAVNILRTSQLPANAPDHTNPALSRQPGDTFREQAPPPIRRILIYNHSHNRYHSLLLVSAC